MRKAISINKVVSNTGERKAVGQRLSSKTLDNRSHGERLFKIGRSPFLCYQAKILTKEGFTMSKTELTDNLTFAAALQMLEQLVMRGLLTADEGERTRAELERKLRPTVFLP